MIFWGISRPNKRSKYKLKINSSIPQGCRNSTRIADWNLQPAAYNVPMAQSLVEDFCFIMTRYDSSPNHQWWFTVSSRQSTTIP